ncbi:hypothetical protein J6590_064975 [Homalodisca vitripennis]|nr:hypothetical protein J6590_064975 [Homalodisca vitripennis]
MHLLVFHLEYMFVIFTFCKVANTYRVAVVEYSPSVDPTVDAEKNMMYNVKNYKEYIKTARSAMSADIIVFPEYGLTGYSTDTYQIIPDPADRVVPCDHNSTYRAALVELSCAARDASIYVVLNLGERAHNSSVYNSNVVFDRKGVVVARYRKIHLNKDEKMAVPNEKPAYFDSDFGVRFGLFTGLDIVFQNPGLDMIHKCNTTHFIYTAAWFSEMPFQTSIQEQWYWSYTADVVLIAAGYNAPSLGSSGSGIYLGRKGQALYNMTEIRKSFMIHADVPKTLTSFGSKNLYSSSLFADALDVRTQGNTTSVAQPKSYGSQAETVNRVAPDTVNSTYKIKMNRDFLDVYTTQLIPVPMGPWTSPNVTEVFTTFIVEDTICDGSLCCEFSLLGATLFKNTKPNITRGDDYSQLYYRLAVFNGVRNYDDTATGGVQICAIIPCIDTDISSCGLRSDDPSANPNSYSDLFYQQDFIFKSITITGNFSTNNSFVGPNVLLEGSGDQFGTLLASDSFSFSSSKTSDFTVLKTLQIYKPVEHLVSASLYGRLFSRDGEAFTDSKENTKDQANTWNYYSFLINLWNFLGNQATSNVAAPSMGDR